MERRIYLQSVAGLVGSAMLAGCAGLGGSATGTLSTKVSDQPGAIEDFKTLKVKITGIRVKPTDGNLQEINASSTVDLTKLTGEATALIDETELKTGSYEFLMLEATTTEAVLKDGGTPTVTVPGTAPLKFNKSFEIRNNQTTTFIADFTPVKAGPTGRYILKPVADQVKVMYE
ncbi:MAG: DUF4382 domain-containing protein [Halobacteriaceae archaeon]